MSAELETRLRDLGADLDWPATPDLAAAVVTRLHEDEPAVAPEGRAARSRGDRWLRRPLAIAVAFLVLAVPAGAVAFPGARDDVLEWLGLRDVEVRRAPELPPDARRPSLDDLGARVSLTEAARRARFAPVVPAALGPPEQVRLNRARVVTLVYDDGRTLLAQLRGRLDRALVSKVVTADTDVRLVPGGGVFFSGGEHSYFYVRPGGAVAADETFLAGPTYVVERGGRVLRLEAPGLTPERAKRLLD